MKEFTYKRDNDNVFVNCSLNFSEEEMKVYKKIISTKGNNGSYIDDQFLIPREKTGDYSQCVYFLEEDEEDHVSLKFCVGSGASADPTIGDIQAEYDNCRDQLLVMIRDVIKLKDMIKLLPE